MHILAHWLSKGIGEPQISNSTAVVGKDGPRKQVCIRFWTVRGNAEQQVVLGVELGKKLVFDLPAPPADCPNRRYSRYTELDAMLKMVEKSGENMRPVKPGGHKIMLWRSFGF